MQKYIDLGAPVTDFEFIGDTANCLCKNDLVRIENKSVREYAVSASSIWEIVISNDMLFCGTVNGELLKIDKNSMEMIGNIALAKQNVKSIHIKDDRLFCACQNKSLYVVDIPSFSQIKRKTNMHPKMFFIVGEYENMLITVSHPAKEFSFWDIDTLENIKTVSVPLCLSGPAKVVGDKIYYSSRNINGIDTMDIL